MDDDFSAFVRTRQRLLLQVGWLLTGDWAAAEDLVQTALLKTAPRWPQVRSGSPEAYVRRVMLTTFLAGRERRWTGEVPVDELPEAVSADDPFTRVGDRDALVAAVRTLPAGQRAVVVLRHVLDLSEADTADALDCSVGTVKSQNARALAALQRLLTAPDPNVEAI